MFRAGRFLKRQMTTTTNRRVRASAHSAGGKRCSADFRRLSSTSVISHGDWPRLRPSQIAAREGRALLANTSRQLCIENKDAVKRRGISHSVIFNERVKFFPELRHAFTSTDCVSKRHSSQFALIVDEGEIFRRCMTFLLVEKRLHARRSTTSRLSWNRARATQPDEWPVPRCNRIFLHCFRPRSTKKTNQRSACRRTPTERGFVHRRGQG